MKNETCTIFACKSKSRGLVIFNFLHAALIGRFGIGMLQEQVGFFSCFSVWYCRGSQRRPERHPDATHQTDRVNVMTLKLNKMEREGEEA